MDMLSNYYKEYTAVDTSDYNYYVTVDPCVRRYNDYWPTITTCSVQEDSTEKSFRILKELVKEKVIPEPDYKKFCKLIEKIKDIV